MNTIIALRGVANVGKSASIIKTYELLRDAYRGAKNGEIFIGVDITVVVTIDGLKVGIESQGDPNSRLFRSLQIFVEIGCDVIICATRSFGRTVEAVEALDQNFAIQWLDKARATQGEEQRRNNEMAHRIFKTVEGLVRPPSNVAKGEREDAAA